MITFKRVRSIKAGYYFETEMNSSDFGSFDDTNLWPQAYFLLHAELLNSAVMLRFK